MHPILFEFGPFKIYSYGLSVALAFLVASFLARIEARRIAIPPEKILNLSVGLLVAGILGARLFYVLQNLGFYIEEPGQLLMLHRGGLTFYGGFVFALIFAIIFLKRENLAIGKVFDMLSPYLALAQAIGRIGCFLNGCCYGKPANYKVSVYFPGQEIGRHPVQIYSSLNLLLIFVILRSFQRKSQQKAYFSGQVFLLYCSLYSLSRFFMEFLRADNLPLLANLTLHQLISAAIFLASCLVWIGIWVSKKKTLR